MIELRSGVVKTMPPGFKRISEDDCKTCKECTYSFCLKYNWETGHGCICDEHNKG